MASRKPSDLSQWMHARWVAFDRRTRTAGIDYLLTCTYRSNEEQATLYAKGRTTPGKIITNAPPGRSAHNQVAANGLLAAEAFDVVPLVNGKMEWDADAPAWQTLGAIGDAVGLEWAGNWKTFKEFPHFQNPNWRLVP